MDKKIEKEIRKTSENELVDSNDLRELIESCSTCGW